MEETNVRLSPEELELVTNTRWILTKNGIIRKVKLLFEALQQRQLDWMREFQRQLPPVAFTVPPKISKGENYRGLPYLVLDHPRLFSKDGILAVRTLFWWGNFFSVTLHLGGRYREQFGGQALERVKKSKTGSLFICIHREQWEHHFEPDNYRSLDELSSSDLESLRSLDFLKLAKKMSLEEWELAPEKLFADFTELLGLLQLPSR